MYLPETAFLADLITPNKDPFKVKSEFKSRDHVSKSQTIKQFVILGGA